MRGIVQFVAIVISSNAFAYRSTSALSIFLESKEDNLFFFFFFLCGGVSGQVSQVSNEDGSDETKGKRGKREKEGVVREILHGRCCQTVNHVVVVCDVGWWAVVFVLDKRRRAECRKHRAPGRETAATAATAAARGGGDKRACPAILSRLLTRG